MKFGLITYNNKPHGRETANTKDKGLFNIGDNIQMIATKRIYVEELHVKEEDIVYIDFHDLETYKGDYVLVLINLYFFGCHDLKETWFPASPYIIPVFIGVHFSSAIFTDREVDYFHRYEPIGCRDEFTLSTMRKYGIDAFLYGCITATLPERDRNIHGNKVFLVDVDEDRICNLLPEKFRNNVVLVSHVFSADFSEETYAKADDLALDLLRRYREEAALVVTSKLHCASPCIAMGIPTIMIVDEKSQRFSWLDNLIRIYTTEEYEDIDWEPDVICYENIKKKMIDVVKKRIRDTIEKYDDFTVVSGFFEQNIPNDFVSPFGSFRNSLKSLFEQNISGYYLWGGTALAEEAYTLVEQTDSKSVFLGLIDEYNEISFKGKKSIKFNDIDIDSIEDNVVFIITPTSSAEYIKSKFIESGLIKGRLLFANGGVVNIKQICESG